MSLVGKLERSFGMYIIQDLFDLGGEIDPSNYIQWKDRVIKVEGAANLSAAICSRVSIGVDGSEGSFWPVQTCVQVCIVACSIVVNVSLVFVELFNKREFVRDSELNRAGNSGPDC